MIPRKALTVAVLFMALHAILAAALPLVDDEAYYAFWASAPQWGYFDHPPMIAWWVALGEGLLGHHPAGVRLLPVLGYGLASLLVARMALVLGGPTAAWRAALLFNATVPVLALGFVATPDAPSVLFWTAALAAALEARRGGHGAWWAVAGLMAGLGVISKLTNLFLGVGIVAWLLATREGRATLRAPWIWLGGVLALSVMAPVAAWNAAHDWVGLQRQFGRIVEATPLQPLGPAVYVAGTLLLVTPLVSWLALRAVRLSGTGFLIWLNAPLVLYLGWHALWSDVPGNWLLPVYPAVAVLAGLGAKGASPWLRRGAPVTGLMLGGLALLVALWPGPPILQGNNPPNQMRGWAETRTEIARAADETGAQWIATGDYGLAARLWWELGPEWQVRGLDLPARYLFLGPMPAALCDAPALLVTRENRPRPAFESLGPAHLVERVAGGKVLGRYELRQVRGLSDWPGCPGTPR
ncbi:MAG: glycosyltransferase family 39 protein [Rhodobacteraceae bacterium]|nr:glycosyltransferase family 39 protein [Paracoccaceae bacterium]